MGGTPGAGGEHERTAPKKLEAAVTFWKEIARGRGRRGGAGRGGVGAVKRSASLKGRQEVGGNPQGALSWNQVQAEECLVTMEAAKGMQDPHRNKSFSCSNTDTMAP